MKSKTDALLVCSSCDCHHVAIVCLEGSLLSDSYVEAPVDVTHLMMTLNLNPKLYKYLLEGSKVD